MKIWIVWLPNVWKSTLFNALTKNYSAEAANFPFCTIEPNVWIVNVNDPRMKQISDTVKAQKIVPANVEFTDIAGIVKWASKGEWLWNKFLANIREADAILQVVRVFENSDIIHVHWNIDPKSDIEVINSELILADIESLEKRINNNTRKAKADKELAAQIEVYSKVKAFLEEWNLAISYDYSDEEAELMKDSHLLTYKPFVYAANVNEENMDISEDELRKILNITDKNIKVVAICAKLEEDMVEMSVEEKEEFLTDMWLKTTGLDELIKTCYDALGLQYYFTAWEKEVRAWTMKKGSTAPEAAWVIHTDFERWFIKADVVTTEDFLELWGWSKSREAWKVSMQGKDYIVQDWDVILFKFNV